jgi:hypothetical protein
VQETAAKEKLDYLDGVLLSFQFAFDEDWALSALPGKDY